MSPMIAAETTPAIHRVAAESGPPQATSGARAVGGLDCGWREIVDELLAIRTLRDDWDGDDAAAPAVELVDFALRLAGLLQQNGHSPPSRASASRSGTVTLEWQDSEGYRELEITSPS